jgi:hypothetical protein
VGQNAPVGHPAGFSMNTSLAHSGLCLAKYSGLPFTSNGLTQAGI